MEQQWLYASETDGRLQRELTRFKRDVVEQYFNLLYTNISNIGPSILNRRLRQINPDRNAAFEYLYNSLGFPPITINDIKQTRIIQRQQEEAYYAALEAERMPEVMMADSDEEEEQEFGKRRRKVSRRKVSRRSRRK